MGLAARSAPLSDLILDASAAVDAALAERGFGFYAGHTLHAPDFLWWEVNSALHEQSWRGRISAERVSSAIDRLVEQRFHRLAPTSEFLQATRDVARRLGWAKVYDAIYVAAALSVPGSRLVTIDERLRRGASRLIDIVGPAEL